MDGACYRDRDESPLNPCQLCDAAAGGFVDKPAETRCGACRTCQGDEGPRSCDLVAAGEDPNNDCTTDCQVCDGWGGCGWAAAETDPNDDCEAEPQASCGRDGWCAGGSDQCAYRSDVDGVDDDNPCTGGDRCDGVGGTIGDLLPDGRPCQGDAKVCRAGLCGDCLVGECPDGRVCEDGSCQLGDCTPSGSACGAGNAWVCGADRICAACTDDAACRGALASDAAVCEGGVCVLGCSANGDCPGPGICAAGRCRPCNTAPGDVVDDCQAHGYGAGVLCLAGACVAGECGDAVACASGRVCLAGACVDCTPGDHGYCAGRGMVCVCSASATCRS